MDRYWFKEKIRVDTYFTRKNQSWHLFHYFS